MIKTYIGPNYFQVCCVYILCTSPRAVNMELPFNSNIPSSTKPIDSNSEFLSSNLVLADSYQVLVQFPVSAREFLVKREKEVKGILPQAHLTPHPANTQFCSVYNCIPISTDVGLDGFKLGAAINCSLFATTCELSRPCDGIRTTSPLQSSSLRSPSTSADTRNDFNCCS